MTASLNNKLLFPFVAPPNGGKGTQTRVLSQKYNLPTFDMGATFRDIFSGKDPEMKARIDQYESVMKAGGLLPDEVVAEVFKKYFENFAAKFPNAPGFILDGFPRTAGQGAELLKLCQDWGAKIGKVFYLNVSLDTAEKRSTGRRVCSQDEGHVYSINEPKFQPKQADICDIDGAPLKIRKDDEPATVQKRLAEYQRLTDPLIAYYRGRNELAEVNGEQAADLVTADLEATLQPIVGGSPALR